MRNIAAAIALIRSFESLFLKAYLDPVKIPTIGWGTIQYPGGRKVKMGDVVTREQAEEYLMHEVREKCQGLEALISVPVNDNQFSALVSFAYNCGTGAFQGSTMRRKLNAGDYAGAANEFLRWNRAKGMVLRGLTRRRIAEKKLFETPV